MSRVRRLVAALRGRPGYLLSGLGLVMYFVVALTPMSWQPPVYQRNGATWRDNGSLSFPHEGVVWTTAPPAWVRTAKSQHRLQLRLRVRSFAADQRGPARIFTLSAGHFRRNLTVAQDQSHLVIRLRTSETAPNGTPPYTALNVFADAQWHDVLVDIQPREFRLVVDGRTEIRDPLPPRPLRNWSTTDRLALGNEHTGCRPWLGEMADATVVVGGQEIDCLRMVAWQVPASYWRDKHVTLFHGWDQYATRSDLQWDALLNFVCFIPVGFCLAAATGYPRPFRFAVGLCAVCSLTAEGAQIFLADHDASLADIVLNLLGASSGVAIAMALLGQARQTQCMGGESPVQDASREQ